MINLDTTLLDDVSNGDSDFKLLLLGMIKEELISSLPEMIFCYEKGDFTGLHTLSHKLKTTLGYAQNQNIVELNTFIEHNSKLILPDPLVYEYLVQMNKLLPGYIEGLENSASNL